jgi:hypothetical protein
MEDLNSKIQEFKELENCTFKPNIKKRIVTAKKENSFAGEDKFLKR